MAENHTLRGLLKSLSTFIGEGAGGLLPQLGWDQNDFEQFVNKGESDTAHESYERRRKAKADGTATKRPAETNGHDDSRKRARSDGQSASGVTFPGLVTMDNSLGANGMLCCDHPCPVLTFVDYLHNPSGGSNSLMFMGQHNPIGNTFNSASSQGGINYKGPSYLKDSSITESDFIFGTPPAVGSAPSKSTPPQPHSPDQNPADHDDPAYGEAQKLIA